MNQFGILEDDDTILANSMAQKEGITLRELQKEIDSLSRIKARDYPQHETNRERAVAKFRQFLHVRKAQCDEVIKQIAGDKVAKAEWEEYKSRSRLLAEKEADICQIGNIKEIAWVPGGGNPSRTEAGKVNGHYSIRVQFKDGSQKSLEVCSDWVENMFREDVLATVQRIGYEIREQLPTVKTVATKTKCAHTFGYVNVESEGQKIM